MSDSELQAIRRRKLQKLRRRIERAKQKKTETADTENTLNRIFKGRAWEVFNAANYQFPKAMTKVTDVLVRLALSGRLKEVTGEQLYHFLRSLGLRVRLNTRIHFTEDGKLKSLAQKIKEDLRKT